MAELRSFVIGVVVAAALLGFSALVFGAFGESDGKKPSVVLLATPEAAETAQLSATGVSTSITVVPAPNTQGAAPSPTSPPPASPTPAPTNTPAPQPTPVATATPAVSASQAYILAAAPVVNGLVSQVSYLIERANTPSVDDLTWQQFTGQAVQNVRTLAGQANALSVPSCLASAHATLIQGANGANSAADRLAAAAAAGNEAAVSQAGAALSSANVTIGQASSAIQAASC
jgi:hypothetical protein